MAKSIMLQHLEATRTRVVFNASQVTNQPASRSRRAGQSGTSSRYESAALANASPACILETWSCALKRPRSARLPAMIRQASQASSSYRACRSRARVSNLDAIVSTAGTASRRLDGPAERDGVGQPDTAQRAGTPQPCRHVRVQEHVHDA